MKLKFIKKKMGFKWVLDTNENSINHTTKLLLLTIVHPILFQRLQIIKDGQLNRDIWFMYYSLGVRSEVALVFVDLNFHISAT